jgi:signal transduction histidine kinase
MGISAGDLQKSDAFGLRGLQERAKTVGGWLDISTNRGNGTSIILTVPLSHPQRFQLEELEP